MTVQESGIIQLRLDPANREAFEKGIECTRVQLALGEDGVFEIHLESDHQINLPHGYSRPPVPLAEHEKS